MIPKIVEVEKVLVQDFEISKNVNERLGLEKRRKIKSAFLFPVEKLSRHTTFELCFKKKSTRFEPIKPSAPVTIFMPLNRVKILSNVS